ncbi:hypothetical protein CS022_09550 [Veronia nyctiphanis]|uniref:OmpR/PhoB-type domain-containing protein n=1 Tax=Veronia nyctiphanis TaxID=1278244 RepID=A0A4Q0YWA6_9GAMM|nr:winged helix-turn-helix domain-containing protein [Veronia nyctiphanis]RXJ73479.1 hypothetical protein CS022_09550 [Veronia nyctiphanis]
MIELGDFVVCEKDRTLNDKSGDEVSIEDKSLAVLLYLIANKDKFVTLEELHENVWSGRVVSDSAVRQSIAKLRKVLGDDSESPQYIKSVPRKGYRLVCSIKYINIELKKT